jgi:ABC-type multidrug transport system fused ATPase/permease subunit
MCLLVGFLGRCLLLGNANVIGLWVDEIATGNSGEMLSTRYLPILIIMALGGFIFTTIFRVVFSRLSATAVSQIYDEVTLRTSRFPIIFFDRTPTGRIVTRFSSDYGNVFRLFGGPLAEFLAIIFDLLAMTALMAVASPLYLPLVLGIAVLNYSLWRSNRERLRQTRRDLSASRSPSIAHFSETAMGAPTVRSFNRENSFAGRFKNLDQNYLKQKLKTTGELIRYSFKMNSLTAVLLLITGISAYFWLRNGWVTVGSLGVALGFITLSGTTVQMFFEWMAQFEEAMVGMERLDQYLRMPIEKGSRLPSQSTFETQHARWTAEEESQVSLSSLTDQPQASVSFKNVWFRYRSDLPFVLKGLNLELKAGERLGIIGRTGSGKSSMIQALFHLYPLTEGEIQVAGKRPLLQLEGRDSASVSNTADLEVFRRSMAFISQESVLFKGKLRENLDITGKISLDLLCEALRRVGLDDFATPEGLEMAIEDRGRNLSLGEKQLICMARCLLQNSPVVIMDEATSSVDPQSEEILVRAINEFFSDRTQIIIAHRLSTLKKCDRILWLDNGEVRQLGTPQEVLPSFENQ